MKQETPWAERPHIGLFGRRNSGKSSLVNALTGQQVALVSEVPGTTTDTVRKSMEMPGVGACVLVDTAGFDDDGELGTLRVEQTRRAAGRMDMALLVIPAYGTWRTEGLAPEKEWMTGFERRGIPVRVVLSQCDRVTDVPEVGKELKEGLGVDPISVSVARNKGLEDVFRAIASTLNEGAGVDDLTGTLAAEGDVVLLVMPQDIQAPKGRLILPQVQTLRNLLDKRCCVMSCTADGMAAALRSLAQPPALIITDSQVFGEAFRLCPPQSRLTSFSVLFARYKGDIRLYMQGAQVLDHLAPDAHVLIAEACTHVPQNEDIGRVKLPRLLRRRFGERLRIDVVSGNDFPEDLTPYDLVIHCGACMFTRRHVMARLSVACRQGVPVTNYGVAIAALDGILDKVAVPD